MKSAIKVYWTGKPCKNGHIDWHRSNNGLCVTCDKIRQAKWRRENKEKARECYNKWRNKNKEFALDNTRKWRAKNIERSRASNRKWKLDNPEKNAVIRHLCDYRRRGVNGTCTKEDILDIFSMQNKKCAFCKKKLNRFHIDHIVPIARGGSGNRSNIQILCASCNHKKHARDQLDFARSLGLLL